MEHTTNEKSYVKKSEQYENINSSAISLFVVGVLVLAALILQTTGTLHIPILNSANPVMLIVLTALAIACIIGGLLSFRQASRIKADIADENKQTENILEWFSKEYTSEQIDTQLSMDIPDMLISTLSPEVLSIYRMEKIKTLLSNQYTNLDSAYLEYLCEELYQRFYES